MKKKIISVFLSVFLFVGGLSVSAPVNINANAASVLGDFFVEWASGFF